MPTVESPGAGEFEKLKDRIRSGVSLPVPSSASMRLLDKLGSPDVTFRELELVISGDPGLAATVLSCADSPFMMPGARQVTIREAVMRLGLEALKAIAISVSLRALHTKTTVLPKGVFAKHSVAVAYTAKVLFARNFMDEPDVKATLTQDEIYAVGLLHDLGLLLYATQDPRAYAKADMIARRADSTVAAAFRHLYEKDLCDLVPALFDRWPHMAKLSQAIVSLGRPWENPGEADALKCLLAADWLVTCPLEMSVENRTISEQPRPEIAALCDIAMGELDALRTNLQAHFTKCGL